MRFSISKGEKYQTDGQFFLMFGVPYVGMAFVTSCWHFSLNTILRMRNMLTIGLIMIHLFAHTEAGQVFRLPNLITHFFQHHRQNPSIDFFQYIAMHYGGDDGTHADDDADNQLPCHNIHNNTLSTVYPALEYEIPSFVINIPLASGYGSILESGNPSKHVLRLLQPPRKG